MEEYREKVFSIQREPIRSDNLDTPPGESFRGLWDIDSIKEAVTIAKKTQDIPRFGLDKVEIHPSGYCNLNCPFCYGLKLAPKSSERQNLPVGTMDSILENIRDEMPEEDPHIVFAGMYSEPLLHPEMKHVVAQLGKHRYRFGIYTNGLMMEKEFMKIVADSAKETEAKKPSYVSFNISASFVIDNFYQAVLPKIEEFAKIIQNVDSPLLINAPILAIGGETNYNLLYPVIRDLVTAGVDNVRLSFPWAPQEGGEVEMYGFLPREDYKRAVEVFQELEDTFPKVTIRQPQMKPFDHCFVMSESLAISPEGDVYPCPEVCAPYFREKYSYGSVITHKVSQLWRGKRHIEVFKNLDPGEEKCICCPVDEDFNKLCATHWQPRFGRRR